MIFLHVMEKQIEKLKEKHGTYREVARILEITERYVMEIKRGVPVSKALQYRIQHEAEKA